MPSLLEVFLNPIQQIVPRLPGAFLTLLVGFIVINFVLIIIGGLLSALRTTKAMHQIMHSVVAVILWVFLGALVMQNLGLQRLLITLSGSIALVSFAIAAGGNKLLNDIWAGFSLAKNRNFKIGQRIKIDTIEGQIHSLDVRKVRVLDEKGILYIVPNAKFDELIWQILPEPKSGDKK